MATEHGGLETAMWCNQAHPSKPEQYEQDPPDLSVVFNLFVHVNPTWLQTCV